MKVSIIGAGAVGATLAQRVLENHLADVVLLDICHNIAKAKALDLLDASPIMGYENNITGTGDYEDIRDSDIVVITAGLPRKPGMSRDELVSKNAAIVRDVAVKIKAASPLSVIIVVTNPLDTMTYLAYKETAFEKEKVMGMAGVLDGSRLAYLIARELKVPRSCVETYILGSHGDTMVPLISRTRVRGRQISDVMDEPSIEAAIKRTRDRGQEIVTLLGSGSAYYSPSAAVLKMISAVLKDTKEILTVSAYLEGEYGLGNVCIGVPCILGSSGIEKIIELDLSKGEKTSFFKSAQAVNDLNKLL